MDRADRAHIPKGTFNLRFYGNRANPGDGKLAGQAVFVNLGVDTTSQVDSLPNSKTIRQSV